VAGVAPDPDHGVMDEQLHTTRVTVANDGRLVDPAPGRRTTGAKVAFHGIGISVMAWAFVVTNVLGGLITLAHSTCGDDVADPRLVGPYRRDLLVLVLVASLGPVGWTVAAQSRQLAWRPWAALAFVSIVFGVATVFGTDQVNDWCV
jgi:hypothetical protein